LIAEIQATDPPLRQFVAAGLSGLREQPFFDYAVDGATAVYGPLGAQRADLVGTG
jgi:hypothetical protein